MTERFAGLASRIVDKKATIPLISLLLVIAVACSSSEQNATATSALLPDDDRSRPAMTVRPTQSSIDATPGNLSDQGIIHFDENWDIELTSWAESPATHPGYINFAIDGYFRNTSDFVLRPPANSEEKLQMDTGEGLYAVFISKDSPPGVNSRTLLDTPVGAGLTVPIIISGTIRENFPDYELIGNYGNERLSRGSVIKISEAVTPTETPELIKRLFHESLLLTVEYPFDWQFRKSALVADTPVDRGGDNQFFAEDNEMIFDEQGCGFLVALSGGSEGPTNIYRESPIRDIGGIPFSSRSWYKTEESREQGKSFFSSYFPEPGSGFDEPYWDIPVIWTWLADGDRVECQWDINQILGSLTFVQH